MWILSQWTSSQWQNVVFGSLPWIVGALIGGFCAFYGPYYIWNQQQKRELKNIANAFIIDLERVYNSNYAWYNMYKNKRYPPGFDENSIMPPDNAFYDANGLYFIFKHDIPMFKYNLSSQIYTFYSMLLNVESERQFVIKNRNSPDPATQFYVSEFYKSMKLSIISAEEQILGLRRQLKEVVGDSPN